MEIIIKIKQLLYKLKNNSTNPDHNIDRILTQVNSKPSSKFTKEDIKEIISDMIALAIISEKVLKDIIELCTYHKLL